MLGISGIFVRPGTKGVVTGMSRAVLLGLFVVARGTGGLTWAVGDRGLDSTRLGPTWTAVGVSTLSLIEKVNPLSPPDI